MLLEKFIVVFVFHTSMTATFFLINGQEHPGSILTGPKNQRVAEGDIAHFNCHARGDPVYWLINGSTRNPSTYAAKGFTFNDVIIVEPSMNELGEYNNTLLVEARSSNNNTRIACRARGQQHGQFDNIEATLVIIDPPSAPPLNLTQHHLIDDAIQHILQWSEPYTPSDFPVTNYTVGISNRLNLEYITVTISNDDFTYTHTSYGRSCYELDFTLIANNRVGQGDTSYIHSGHPVVWSGDLEMWTSPLVLSNGMAILNITFQVPNVCPGYQNGTYNIIVYDNTSQQITQLEPIVYGQENITDNYITMEIKFDAVVYIPFYELEIVIDRAGCITSNRTKLLNHISDDWQTRPPTGMEEILITHIDRGLSKNNNTRLAIFTASFVGGGALLVLFILIITILACKSHKRKHCSTASSVQDSNRNHSTRHTHTRSSNLKVQANNPIYEGVVYETMPGESLKSLLSPTTSSPSTPTADLMTRYVFDQNMLPSVPPPRKALVCQKATLESVDEPDKIDTSESLQAAELPTLMLDDNYMIMCNQQAASKEAATTMVD